MIKKKEPFTEDKVFWRIYIYYKNDAPTQSSYVPAQMTVETEVEVKTKANIFIVLWSIDPWHQKQKVLQNKINKTLYTVSVTFVTKQKPHAVSLKEERNFMKLRHVFFPTEQQLW